MQIAVQLRYTQIRNTLVAAGNIIPRLAEYDIVEFQPVPREAKKCVGCKNL